MRYVNLIQNIDQAIFLFQNIQILFHLFRTLLEYYTKYLLVNKNVFVCFGKFGKNYDIICLIILLDFDLCYI